MSGFKLDPERWYTVKDLVALLDLDLKDPARSLVRSGIPFRKIGTRKYFSGVALLAHFGVKVGGTKVLPFERRTG